jgi:hypothetical protein
MKREISDFSLSKIFLQSYCNQKNVPFKELPVFIDEGTAEIVDRDDIIYINGSENICDTSYRIIKQYLEKSKYLYGENILDMSVLSIIKKYLDEVYDTDNNPEELEPFQRSLYQNPFLWILFDNIICPGFNIQSKNIPMIMVSHPYIDVSLLVSKDDENYILVNVLGNENIQDAFTFVSILEYYEIDKTEFMRDLLSGDIFQIFINFVIDIRGRYGASDFIDCIINIIDKNLYTYLPLEYKNDVGIKQAQQLLDSDMFNPWWILGITEQMLAPAQRPNPQVYFNTEKPVIEFWKEVSKKMKGKDPKSTTIEKLLQYRVEHEATDSEVAKTISNQIESEHELV